MLLAVEINNVPFFIFLFIVLFVIPVLYGLIYGKKAVILREMRKSKAKPIGSIREGEYVKVMGKALHVKKPLIAPISERPCIFYHVEVVNTGGKNDKIIIDETRTQDFFLEQNGEMVMVKMDQAYSFRKIYLVQDHQYDSGTFKNKEDRLEEYLARHGENSKYWLGIKKDLTYKEGIIGLDEVIAVKGIAQWKNLKEPIEGYSYSKILSLHGSKDKKLLITDHKRALKDPKN